MFYNAFRPFYFQKSVSFNSLIRKSYPDLQEKEINVFTIAYTKYCCIFMAQLKSVGDN